ncbi:MAG: hypothetical protein AAB590_02780 [Patescibacteria group bacterium]
MADEQLTDGKIIRTLSKEALEIVKDYENVPYYNNKHRQVRMALRVLVGKGSPEEIAHEVLIYALREKVDFKNLTPELQKKFLIEHNIGIDCSGLAYYILDAESTARGKGTLASQLNFPSANGPFMRLGRFFRRRYVENAGVRTFAYETNSHEIPLLDITPADLIVILESGTNISANHVLIVTQVNLIQNMPTEIHYIHSIAWPVDGKFGHGVREGRIAIKNINKSLLDQTWIENGKIGLENFTYHKASAAGSLSLRRLNWL